MRRRRVRTHGPCQQPEERAALHLLPKDRKGTVAQTCPVVVVLIPDWVAAQASEQVCDIWRPETNVILERTLWVRVMQVQRALGVDIPEWAIYESRRVASRVDLDSIRRRELVTRHDVKARIEEFAALSGHQYLHLGMTSADVVDNLMLVRMRQTLLHLGRIEPRLALLARSLPFRGIKGPVGTQQDQMDLLGSAEACEELDRRCADIWGFESILGSVGQVYPRSLDFQYVSGIVSALASHASPLKVLLPGYLHMATAICGDQWNEGDVSHSAVRRVFIPGAAYVASAILECGA